MKLFECDYEVQENGREHRDSILVYAESHRKANVILHRAIRNYFMDENEDVHGENGGYWLDGYGVFITPLGVREIDKQEWMENEFMNKLYQ